MAKRSGGGAPSSADPTLAPATRPLERDTFSKALGTWYRQHARELPWRGISNPYATWLSEIMLQQTRVATVLERYEQFLRRFPSVAALAAAPEDAVLALWSGLGYYRRARMLHRGAQFVQRELRGEIPHTATELRTLPGVGEYTAAAIASIAFGESVAVLDGNVERVLLRLLGLPEDRTAATRALLLRTANDLVPPKPLRRGRGNPPGDHNQAMMELGATICLPRGPLCLQCPVLDFCKTRGEHVTPARKQLRSRRIACLLATRKRGTRTEVLLERRSAEASLMAGMLELPPLPLEAITQREPILRLRHSITNTNFYVEVYTEASTDALASDDPEAAVDGGEHGDSRGDDQATRMFPREPEPEDPEAFNEDEAVFLASDEDRRQGFTLRSQVPARDADLQWFGMHKLYNLPLTGLTRKALQRLGLMKMQDVGLGNGRSV